MNWTYRLLVLLPILVLTLGQMCTSPEDSAPVALEPVAPIANPPPVVVPPAVVPVITPADPVTTPPIIVPPVVVPPVVVPPIVDPPVVVPPVVWPAKIIEPLEVRTKTSSRFLSAEEITYFWIRDCSPGSPMLTEDPFHETRPDLLLMERYPDISEHIIFARLQSAWPGRLEQATLWLYLINFNCDSFFPVFPVGPIIYRSAEDWRPRPLDWETWEAYCYGEILIDQTEDCCFNTPEKGTWYEFDITSSCQLWQSEEQPNYGVMIRDANKWYVLAFASPLHDDEALRPQLELFYRPALELKLPLPGDKAWILTTEAIGNHSNALDLSYSSAKLGVDGKPKTTTETDVPILAAGEGVVIAAKEDDKVSLNGGYVKIKHLPEGYVTCYLHLKPESIKVKVGDCLAQGAQLGLMGTTGNSTGVHIHFQVQWVGKEVETAERLAGVTVEGRPLGDFKVGYEGDNYYESTNTP